MTFRFRSAIILRKIFLVAKEFRSRLLSDAMALIKPFGAGSPSTCTLTSSPILHSFFIILSFSTCSSSLLAFSLYLLHEGRGTVCSPPILHLYRHCYVQLYSNQNHLLHDVLYHDCQNCERNFRISKLYFNTVHPNTRTSVCKLQNAGFDGGK